MEKAIILDIIKKHRLSFNRTEQGCFEQNFDLNIGLIESITRTNTDGVKPYCQPMTDYDMLREDNAKTNG